TGLSVSASGIVAYRRGQTSRQLAWFDRSGTRIGQVGGEAATDLRYPAISSKGRIAIQWNSQGGQIFLIDAATSAPSQFTFSPGEKHTSRWSPDGLWLAFVATADYSLRRKRSNGAGDEEILLPKAPGMSDWSPDGRSILLSAGGNPKSNISVLSLEGKPEARAYLANPAYAETRGMFSPNGRWVAYESNESGRFEIYVRSFPDPSRFQTKVSSDGGNFARWSRDGRELYYLTPAGVLMAVPVNIEENEFSWNGPAQALFRTRISARELSDANHPYDVSADGHFLMPVVSQEQIGPITLILNWSDKN